MGNTVDKRDNSSMSQVSLSSIPDSSTHSSTPSNLNSQQSQDSSQQTLPESPLTSQPNTEKMEQKSSNIAKTDSTDDITDSIPLELSPEDIETGEFLGEGVYSEVYKGFCYGSQVAVKKFKNQGFDKDLLAQIRKEIRIMKSIRHPNLLLFLGACTKPGYLMIVTELMEQSFHDLNNSKKDLFTKLKMAREAAKGISWLHSLTPVIIHRDLKPENILCDESGKVVKVADFGLSLVKDHSKQEAEEMKKIRGSPAFMSPEALLGKELTPKTDVYSFGMILWELLTGRSPYEDLEIESFEQLIEEISNKGTRETIPDDAPVCLRRLLEACWKGNPEERPNFLQILAQLDDCLLEVGISDNDARKFWKDNFTENGILKLEVSWKIFLPAIAKHPYINLATNLKIFQGLKLLLVKNDRDMVFLEEFGNVLKWFGPLGPDSKSEPSFLHRMQNLFTKRWFHGDIDLQTAQTRLAGTPPGTFLIRFSSNPGAYALSKIIEQNNEQTIVHVRIAHLPGSRYSFVLDDKVYEFNNLDDLIKSPVLHLGDPCSGSKYYAQFRIKQVHSGYITSNA